MRRKFTWNTTSLLAAQHRLPLYEAIYLELAKRQGLPLITLDLELRAAARAENILLLGQ